MSNDHEKDVLVDRAAALQARLKLAEELLHLFWPQHPVAQAQPDGSLSVRNADGTEVVVAAGEGCSVRDGVVTPAGLACDHPKEDRRISYFRQGFERAMTENVCLKCGQHLPLDTPSSAVKADNSVTLLHNGVPNADATLTPWAQPMAEYVARVSEWASTADWSNAVTLKELMENDAPSAEIAVTDEMIAVHWKAVADIHLKKWSDCETKMIEAETARDYWHDMHRHLRSSFDDVNAKLMDTRRQVVGLEAELALARGIITALTTPQAPPGDVTTASKPNPFRSFDGDRRRVGG